MSKVESKYNSENSIIEYNREQIEEFAKMYSLDRLREIKESYLKNFETIMEVAEKQADKIYYIEEVEKYFNNVKDKVNFDKYIERLQNHIERNQNSK